MTHAIIVVDLGYGDAGKGTMTEFFAQQHSAHTVVRFNGGAQAGHNIIAPDGRHHTFSQFGSATLLPGVRTHLSRFMVLHPLAMISEAEHLESLGVHDAFERTTIDARAVVITPFHQAANRLRELSRGNGRHGSCGVGVGETMSDFVALGDQVPIAGDLANPHLLRQKLHLIRQRKRQQLAPVLNLLKRNPLATNELAMLFDDDLIEACVDAFTAFAQRARIVTPEHTHHLLNTDGTVVFEGAQGVLLDQWHGFHPYVTWSTTTFENALTLLSEGEHQGPVTRVGVVRAYGTRHGPGPFVTEDLALTHLIPDMHNAMHPWQRGFRVGWFDAVATRYALEVCGGCDGLAVTCLDRLNAVTHWQNAASYDLDPSHSAAGLLALGDDTPQRFERIVPDFGRQLDHQRALARVLEACTPHYEGLELGPASASPVQRCAPVWEALGKTLNVPVRWTSSGPTLEEKQAV